MGRLASLLDSILWHRERRPVSGGSCQVSVESACLSFYSGLSSRNGGAASASADFIWSNVWCTKMSQDSLSSCRGCLSWLHFSPTTCTCASESGYQVGYQAGSSSWEDHAGTSLLASCLYLSAHMGERRSLMGSPLGQAPKAGAIISSLDMARYSNQKKIRTWATERSLHADRGS